MTKLNRPVIRETYALEPRTRRPLVITLEGKFLRIKEKGTRSSYTVTYGQIYVMGAKNKVGV